MIEPPLGHTQVVNLSEVIDGDTVRVRISYEIDVRLTDDSGAFDAPETRTKDGQEKSRGMEAKAYLTKFLQGKRITLYVPTDGSGRVKKILTLSRVVGKLFADGVDVAQEMIDRGFIK